MKMNGADIRSPSAVNGETSSRAQAVSVARSSETRSRTEPCESAAPRAKGRAPHFARYLRGLQGPATDRADGHGLCQHRLVTRSPADTLLQALLGTAVGEDALTDGLAYLLMNDDRLAAGFGSVLALPDGY